MKTKILIIITALFFAIMLALTFTARSVHEAGLPHVKAGRLAEFQFPFEFTDENGNVMTGSRQAPVVTREQLERGVYVLYTAEKNGETRDFAQRAEIVCGAEYDGYIEVLSGVTSYDKIVVESDRDIAGGSAAEVKLISTVRG